MVLSSFPNRNQVLTSTAGTVTPMEAPETVFVVTIILLSRLKTMGVNIYGTK